MKLIHRLANPEGTGALDKVYWNSAVSIVTNIVQNVFFSAFFIILARHFGPVQLSDYVIANSLYQLIGVLAPFGLTEYFVREYMQQAHLRSELTRDMVVVESLLGVTGYLVVVSLGSIMGYSSGTQLLAIILAININFDNLLVSFRSIFVAESKQFYTSIATLLESFLKLLAGLCLLVLGLTLLQISLFAVALRLVTLFVAIGFLDEERRADVRFALNPANVSFLRRLKRVVQLLGKARSFAVISTVVFIYWRLNTLVLGKIASPREVSFFDVGTKAFSVFQILPFYYLQAFFPILSQAYKSDKAQFVGLARKALTHLAIFSVCVAIPMAYASREVIDLLFGSRYLGAAGMTGTMMITLIPFSLSLVQAYVLLASGNERIDMWLNILTLGVNGLLAIVLTTTRGGNGAALSILISFIVFFLAQQIVLLWKGLRLWHGLTLKVLTLIGVHLVLVAAAGRLHTFLGIGLGQLGFWALVLYWKMLDLPMILGRIRLALAGLGVLRYSGSIEPAQ